MENTEDYFYSYDLLCSDYMDSFEKNYGSKKSNEIIEKVKNSKSVDKLVETCYNHQFLPLGKIILETLLGTRHFMFSKREILAFASLITLKKVIYDLEVKGDSYSEENKLKCAKSIFSTVREV